MAVFFCGLCLAAAVAGAIEAARARRKARILRDQLIAFHAAGLKLDARCAALEDKKWRCGDARQQV